MKIEKEVVSFLKDFKEKMKIWNVYFRDDRSKNLNAMLALELRSIERKNVLETLEKEDYSSGPIEDKLNGSGDLWVFGKIIKKKEVYIKITLGAPNSGVICISFHLAEHKMNYPLK